VLGTTSSDVRKNDARAESDATRLERVVDRSVQDANTGV